MDNRTKEQRSKNMRAVKSKNTGLELRLRKALWKEGLRYRLKSNLPGRPDLIFPSAKAAVFCDGCFWHGCPYCNETPEQNRSFWIDKISKNKERDISVNKQLDELGWKVLRYWGCEINSNLTEVVKDIKRHIKKQEL